MNVVWFVGLAVVLLSLKIHGPVGVLVWGAGFMIMIFSGIIVHEAIPALVDWTKRRLGR